MQPSREGCRFPYGQPIPRGGLIANVRLLNKDLPVNAAIELHDSIVMSIVEDDGTIVLELTAYLHQSDGRPGIDPGTGWTQTVRLMFPHATKQCTVAKFPNTILDGVLSLSGEQFANGFAIPIEHIGPTILDLEFANNISVTIEGRGLQVECLGTRTFVETFRP